MTPADLSFLLSATGRRWLQTVDFTTADHLSWATTLRRELSQEQVHAILETALLRQKGERKFERAAQMFFTREALEQASGEEIARYRAGRFVTAGMGSVVDLGCGIGGDALALTADLPVFGFDLDEIRLLMARENVRLYHPAVDFYPVLADIETLPPFAVDALFFDPARRDEQGRRLFSLSDYRPSLDILDRWRPLVSGLAVKISPGVSYAELPPAHEAEVEFISVRGEVKEAVLWYGGLRCGRPRSATLLPAGVTIAAADEPVKVGQSEPLGYLFEPDGAVIRAHLVQELAADLGGKLISPDIAYITTAAPQSTPLARCFVLDDWFPFQLKRLRRYLRERGIGQVVVKKRGSPIDPDQLSKQLRGPGDGTAVVFLTRVQDQPAVLIGRPWEP